MPDKTLIIDLLEQLEEFIRCLIDGTSEIEDFRQLPMSPKGMLLLNGICMSFVVIGEEVKRIDKYTESRLLAGYPSIPWKRVMGMRDRIAHGYFQVDVDIISDTLKNDIPPLFEAIKQMKADLENIH